jgi:SAM-dependent methyltransferase
LTIADPPVDPHETVSAPPTDAADDAGERRCPACGSVSAHERYRMRGFEVFACDGCDTVYIWPRPSAEAVRALFTDLYTGTGDADLPELRGYYGFTYEDRPDNPLVERYEAWLDVLGRHRAPGRLLDVGCGTGLFCAVARRRGWTVTGVDESAVATAHAREHFGVDAVTADLSKLPRAETFQAVTMWDILEHSRAPVELLRTARALLAPDGVLGLTVPNQRSLLEHLGAALYRASGGRSTAALARIYIPQHFTYFSPRTLRSVLARAELTPLVLAQESTDLRRLTLAPPVRALLHALFAVARWTGRENRLLALARASNG